METLHLTSKNVAKCAEVATSVLGRRGIILYPTDTLYGLAADAFSNEAVDTIYEIKGRDEHKPIHCVVADVEMASTYGEMNVFATRLAKQFWPGALTLILKKNKDLKTGIARNIETIGMRVPDNAFCLELACASGKPYTTTSANKAGMKPEFSVEAILDQLGNAKEKINIVVDAGVLPVREASTVVDLSGDEPVILREGAIPTADIWETIRQE